MCFDARMVKYHFPKPAPGDPVHGIVPPIPVRCDWPISGTFKPPLEGLAVAWSGTVTLVRVGEGEPKWVDTASVERLSADSEAPPPLGG